MIKILIIDHQSENIAWLQQNIAKNYTLIVPTKEHEFFSITEQQNISAMIITINNTTADRLNLLKKIKAHQNSSKIPVIILEDHVSDDILEEYAKVGVFSFYSKNSNAIFLNHLLKTAASSYHNSCQLIDKNQYLQKRNHQINEFVAIISHDLRIPIGNLSSIYDLLEKSPELIAEFLPQMKLTTSSAYELLQNLLDLMAVETGSLQLTVEPTNVSEICSQAIQETKHLADKKKILINNQITKSYLVLADARRILQVLYNLISNAIKFTPINGLITVQIHEQDQQVFLEIIDTGVGIPPEKIKNLFLNHKKTSTLGTDGERGTGFGLPLSQKFIQAHGSEIKVTSEIGQGSKFSFPLFKP